MWHWNVLCYHVIDVPHFSFGYTYQYSVILLCFQLFLPCPFLLSLFLQRLLANAMQDPLNARFVLVSESDVPLHGFRQIYHYLMTSRHSFTGGAPVKLREWQVGAETLGRAAANGAWLQGEAWFELSRP